MGKKISLILSIFIMMVVCILFISACVKRTTEPADTEAPTVIITYPANNSLFVIGTVIDVVAEAEDNEEIDKVVFYINGVNTYEDSTEPYGYSWNTSNLNGVFTIYAEALDSSENTTMSDIVNITISSLWIEHIFEISDYAMDISVTDSYLYIAEDQAGYSIFDLDSNELVSHHESFIMETDPVMFENVRAITAVEDENLLFVYDRYGSPASINIFDMTDKTDPTFLFQLVGNTGIVVQLKSEVNLDGGADLYWTNGATYNFGRFDQYWQENDSFAFQNSIERFDVGTNRIYISAEQLGFHIVDRSNGDIISTTDTDAVALDVKIVDNYLIVALRQAGFAVYDISSVSNPMLVCQKETNEYIYTIDVEGDNMVLGSHSGGVYLYDISDVTNPELVGNLNSVNIGYTFEAVLHNGKIYASTRQGVYKIGIE